MATVLKNTLSLILVAAIIGIYVALTVTGYNLINTTGLGCPSTSSTNQLIIFTKRFCDFITNLFIIIPLIAIAYFAINLYYYLLKR